MWWGIGLGVFLYIVLLFTLGLMTLRKGHWVMFILLSRRRHMATEPLAL